MKLLVSDLDGTLYPKSSVTNPNQFEDNIKALHKWLEHGHKFVAATARPDYHYPILAERLGFKPVYIGCNGAVLIFENGEMLTKSFPMSVFIELADRLNEWNYNAAVGTHYGDFWIWNDLKKYPFIGAPHPMSTWISSTSLDAELIHRLPQDFPLVRIQIFVELSQREELRKKVEDLHLPVNIVISDFDLIDIGPLNCSKGISIHELCDYYQITEKDLIVAGDSENVIPMFECTENSYCIDHADEEVKSHATYIVASLQEAIEAELAKEK